MSWLIYALSGSIFKASTGLFRKKVSSKIHAMVFAWLNNLIIAAALLPFVLVSFDDLAKLLQLDFLLVLGAAAFSLTGVILNIKALDREDLSFVAPLSGFIPLFTLLYAWIFLAEVPPTMGIIGLAIIIIGTYVVAIKPGKIRWYDPILHLARSPAAWMSLGVAASYAINTVFIKATTDVGHSPLAVMYATNFISLLLASYILLTRKRRQIVPSLRSSGWLIIGSSISTLLSGLLHTIAVSLTYASYAASVRRFDSVFSIVLGWKVLGESNIRNKLIGGSVMFVGITLLAISL